MEAQRPVFWHQGQFLQPQHFQLLERGSHALFLPYRSHLAPHFWGLCSMEVAKEHPGVRSFGITNGSFLYPDGTHVVLPGNAVIESRCFQESMVERPCTVYLGLKRWDDDGANVTVIDDGVPHARVATRYATSSGAENCPDLHAGERHGEVRRLDLVLRVFWESEIDSLGDYLLIPVGRLERTRDGVELSRSFIPPCISLSASPRLLDTVREIRDLVASRSRNLERFKHQKSIQNAEFGSRDLAYLLALRTLNRYLAQLVHMIEAKEVHPWQVYGVLRQLVGELSSFSETVTAQGESVDGAQLLPEYDHQEIGSCFSQAHDLILKLLDQITSGPEYALPLSWDGTWFAAEMKPSHLESRNRFYLALRTGDDTKAVVQSVTSLAKLCSRERLPLLVAQALPGIGLEHLPNPPQELPRGAGTVFFAIDSRCEQWELVQKWKNIALCWDQAPADLEVEVMIVARP